METRLSQHAGVFSTWATSSFFPTAVHLHNIRLDFIHLLLFCMVAKHRRATLARSPDSSREHDIAAVYDHGFEISFVGADVNVLHKVDD